MTEIRFLHIADLHLDSPFKGISSIPQSKWNDIRESTFNAFTNIVEYALENKPDFVLIVGDIYDGENRSLRAQHLFQKGMEALQSEGIPVFICYGNHDHLSGNWVRFQLPDNVQEFGGDVETKTLDIKGQKVNISGFSYKERHVLEGMHTYYPTANGQHIHIGMLHGSVEGNVEHDVYAPFQKNNLIAKGYDYWALGHIHKRQTLHDDPPIVYPGNTQSRHRNEKGLKGFYDVTLTKHNAMLRFIPSSAFLYDVVEVSCEGIVHANELIKHIELTLDHYRKTNGNALIELILTDITEETNELIQGSSKEEWLFLLQENLEMDSPFIIVKDLHITHPNKDRRELNMLLDIMKEWDSSDWKHVLKDLYRHPKGSRYLPTIDELFLNETLQEAEHLLSKVVTKVDKQ
ncbi:DNA repair exonuclease [Psychrobacillus sp. OK032]|uniref:metallophosphoesterase family protein n=1 Tax=Psychrobacillus sp. OK032 TaxID=1884358 RepID=UPI0008D09BC0|nr:DNA repair exonuclease [Psychrobacillus sp. OK032]SES19830.1 DNA repair exonuclease SbcCD nuclease subunit [Psychrobacillus sp. OK032]